MKRIRIARSSRRRATRPQRVRTSRSFRPLLEQLEDRRLLATVAVNTTSDVSDGTTTSIAALLAAPGADGFISLREAILAANNTANVDGPDAGSDPDPDVIHFSIAGTGVKTITPTSALPAITQAVVIDGYSQPGASANTLVVGSNAALLIELAGGSGPGNALTIAANGATVRGLVINRFGSAIFVQSGGNTIEGNWLGIDDDGNTRLANEYDVFINNSVASANNLIGGTTPGSRNVLAGTANNNAGIMLFAGGSATIQGNYIGMNAQGTDGIGASGRIYLGTAGNVVGGTAPGAGNVISGRAIDVFASGNTVQGNTFGLNASGTGTLANNLNGIFVFSHSIPTDNNLIGGTTPEARNVFATRGTAIDIANSSGPNVGNRIQGNYFGTNKAGTAPAGAPSVSGTAIRFSGGMNNLVGGTTAGAGNVITGYVNGSGIEVLGSNNTIQGNRIGTNAAGTAAISNGTGIFINSHISNTLIGGSTPGAANVISGNLHDGILIAPGGRFNTIQGNLIGVAVDGISPLGNGAAGGNPALRNGIRAEGSDNLIGGTEPGEGNTIAFNFGSGALLPLTNVLPNSGLRNSVQGNSLYANGGLGIDIFGGGVTVNDPSDTDSGPNDIQNFPVITSATTGATTTITGTLNSTPNRTFRVEFFASVAADPSGFGEGQNYLGFAPVTTDGSGNGSFSFSPAVAIPAGQFITATATAAGNTSEFSAIRTVVAVPVNQPPTITSNGGADTATVAVPENTTAVTTVAANDPDVGTTLTYSIVGGADSGKFSINATSGALAFATAPDFEAPTDSDTNNSYVVIVQASDGSLTDSQTLTVTVTNANEPPVITSNGGDDSASVTVPENTTAVTTVTAMDADAGTTIVYSISGGADAAQFAINPSSGELTFITAPNFEAPTDAGADNVYDVVVATSDGSALDTQAIAVSVLNAYEPPVITSNGGGDTATIVASENTTAVTTVMANDPDAGPTLTYSIVGGPDMGQFSINATSGELAFTTAPDFEAPADADVNNSYRVIVQASDGSLTDSQTLTVTVTNANEPPVITSNGGGDSASVSVPENTTVVTMVTATDPDAGTTIVYSISGGADAGQFAINTSSGDLTFIEAPNFEAPTDAGADNVYDVVVAANDGSALDTQVLSVNVSNANESPTITSNGGGDSASVNVPENTTAVTTVMAMDPDAGAMLAFSIVGGADAAQFSINATTGALRFITAPNSEAPTDANADNIYNVFVQVSDGALTDTQSLTVTLTNVNEAPFFTSAPVTAATEDVGYTYAVITADPDFDDMRSITSLGLPTWLNLVDNGNGTASLIGTPTNDDLGSHSVELVVTDAAGASAAQSFTITVANVNDAPYFTSTPVIAATEDAAYSYALTSADPDFGDTRTIISTTLPTWLTLVDNGDGTATLDGHPTNADGGDHPVELVVMDAAGASTVQSFTIIVSKVNDSPFFTSTPVTGAAENAAYAYAVTTADPDVGDTRTITATILPTWLTLAEGGDGTAALSGTPSSADVGTHAVELVVTDAAGATSVQSFPIIVTPSGLNLPPQITTLSSSAPNCGCTIQGTTVTIQATFMDTNAGDTHTAMIDWGDGQTSPGSVNEGAGTVSAEHVYAEGGIYAITMTLADQHSALDQETMQAVISGVALRGGVLQIIGTSHDDHVTVNKLGNGLLKVHADFLPNRNFRTFQAVEVEQIVMLLCDGDDHATVAGNIAIETRLDGGEGSDHLNGGRGPNILLGGAGDDMLIGGAARDLMIGGLGADRLVGNSGDDLLIGGTTDYDDNSYALDAILAEWTSGLSYAQRVSDLSSGSGFNLNDTTVHTDDEEDTLTGSAGADWFFANLHDMGGVLDKITDAKSGETASDLD